MTCLKTIVTIIFFSFQLFFLSSCSVSSKVALGGPGGRNSYNTTLQMTTSEQMLLNLVRLRFCESPYFLDVNTITTQFTYSTKAHPIFFIPGFNQTNPFELGGEFAWQNQPTIQYTPLEGQAFATQLLKPIDILTIQHLVLSGWDVDRVLKLTIQSFDKVNNATSAGGPIPDKIPDYQSFFEIAHLMRRLQLEGALHVGSISSEALDEEQKSTNRFITDDSSMRIIFPSSGETSDKLSSLLSGCKKKNGNYILDLQLGFTQDAYSSLIPRSILGCMYYLSLGVIVPDKYTVLGAIPTIKKDDGTIFNWQDMLKGLLTIKNSEHYPDGAFTAIKFKDYWYYIDNNDIPSKRTFVLLQLLYNLQSHESKRLPTLLSLPIGK